MTAHCCSNYDYGIHEIFINGHSCGTHDFYAAKINWPLLDLGNIHLNKAINRFEVVAKGSNPKADKRRLFALDYIKLEKVHAL